MNAPFLLWDNLRDLIRVRKKFRFRTALSTEECASLLQDMNQSGGCFRDGIRASVAENPQDLNHKFKILIFGGRGMTSAQATGTILRVTDHISQIEGYVRLGYDLLIFNLIGLIFFLGLCFAVSEQLMSAPCQTIVVGAIFILNWCYPIRDFHRLDRLIRFKLFELSSPK